VAASTYLPRTEAGLVDFSTNFNDRLVAGGPGGAYGIPAITIAQYTALHDAWIAAYTAANQDITRTPVSIQAKNDAKDALINGTNGIRQLVNIIQHNPATTNEQRAELQITVPDVDPTPVPVPEFAPLVSVKEVNGRSITLRLRDSQNPDSRRKPFGVFGAQVYAFVGDDAPAALSAWQYKGITSKTETDIEFPVEVAAGAKVWFTCQWVNTRSESGPASSPIFTFIEFGDVAEAA
jgi:hypothetical protein